MRKSLRYTTFPAEECTNATTQPCLTRRVNTETDKVHISQRLRLRHPDLNEGLNYTSVDTLLDHASLHIGSFIKWLVGSSCALASRKHFERVHIRCRLCGSEHIETRQHLPRNCPATEHERQQYRKRLLRI